jgi:hypothetical protein
VWFYIHRNDGDVEDHSCSVDDVDEWIMNNDGSTTTTTRRRPYSLHSISTTSLDR